RLYKAHTKATMTRTVVTIALVVDRKIALFNSVARRFRRGTSAFKCALAGSSGSIAFNARERSMMRFMREISTEMKAATAPSRNAGAVICEMTWDSWVTDDVSGSMIVHRACPETSSSPAHPMHFGRRADRSRGGAARHLHSPWLRQGIRRNSDR